MRFNFQWQIFLGWSLATCLAFACIYGLNTEAYQVNGSLPPWPVHVLYGGFARFAWGLSLAWLVFACVKGYGGIHCSYTWY